MYAAISGLQTHMKALAVIGNNISNVNTVGYKAARYTFNEALYSTSRGGSDGTTTAGGRNPAQNGFGASIGTIDIDMSTKNYTPTGWGLDTMIDGDGFFIVGDKVIGEDELSKITLGDLTTLKSMNLTRLGNFNIDPTGYLVDGNGSVAWGFLCVEAAPAYNPNTGEAIYPSGDPPALPPETATGDSPVKYLKNMTEQDIKDLNSARRKSGLPELTNITYTEKMETVNGQEQIARDDNGDAIMVVKSATVPATQLSAMRLPVLATKTKMVQSGTGDDAEWVPVSPPETVTEIVWVDPDSLEDGKAVGTVEWDPPLNADGGGNTGGGNAGTATEQFRIEYTRVESDSVTIDEKTGALRIMTSDGTLYTVGYLAIAKVTNPNGVTHVDGRYYQALDGAGTIRVTSVGGAVAGVETSGGTGLVTGGLESSGTDLATEIANMIAVQRGYQANTRIVTVTDSMLEELVNMKR